MAEANANGIDVEEDFSWSTSHLNNNAKARCVLYAFANEDAMQNAPSDVRMFGNNHSLFIKNNSNGKMFFAFFD